MTDSEGPHRDLFRGYASPEYARSLAEFGEPRYLPHCDGWLLERKIPGTAAHDAMGCYPLFSCTNWAMLKLDLELLEDDLVSVAIVADPLGDCERGWLEECFPAVAREFKAHYLVDLATDPEHFVSAHHRRNVRFAQREVEILQCDPASKWLDRWCALYGSLIQRHDISGIKAFSRASFAAQLEMPDLRAWRAVSRGETVAMTLWLVRDDIAYYHLGATSERGYQTRANFAMFWQVLRDLRSEGIRIANLGASAGLGDLASDGLGRFKRGWSNGSTPALFCGRINDHDAYRCLTTSARAERSGYFPAYRDQELA